MTAVNGQKPVLNLDDLFEPEGYFIFGGKRYDYRPVDSLTLREQKEIARDYRRLVEIDAAESVSEEESSEHTALTRSLITRVSSMTANEAVEVPLYKLGTAVSGFFVWRGNAIDIISAVLTKFGMEMRTPSTGETSSPDSRSAMEEHPSNG